MEEFTHIDAENQPGMVDVSDKSTTKREAVAECTVELGEALLQQLESDDIQSKKGPVFQTAIIAGTMAGAAIGGSIGQTMDEVDRMKTAQSLEAVRTGVPSAWQNPDTGNQYSVTPTRTFVTAEGPCREYTINALIGGRQETVYGTACRQPDGSWSTS